MKIRNNMKKDYHKGKILFLTDKMYVIHDTKISFTFEAS